MISRLVNIKQCITQVINNHNKIGNISIRYCFTFIYEFYNFVILSGLLLFVFGVDNEVAFCKL